MAHDKTAWGARHQTVQVAVLADRHDYASGIGGQAAVCLTFSKRSYQLHHPRALSALQAEELLVKICQLSLAVTGLHAQAPYHASRECGGFDAASNGFLRANDVWQTTELLPSPVRVSGKLRQAAYCGSLDNDRHLYGDLHVPAHKVALPHH